LAVRGHGIVLWPGNAPIDLADSVGAVALEGRGVGELTVLPQAVRAPTLLSGSPAGCDLCVIHAAAKAVAPLERGALLTGSFACVVGAMGHLVWALSVHAGAVLPARRRWRCRGAPAVLETLGQLQRQPIVGNAASAGAALIATCLTQAPPKIKKGVTAVVISQALLKVAVFLATVRAHWTIGVRKGLRLGTFGALRGVVELGLLDAQDGIARGDDLETKEQQGRRDQLLR
jgi:hypothetical protein